MEARGQVAHVKARTDTKGRKQPAKKRGRDVGKLAAKKGSRSADELAAQKQPADTMASRQQPPLPTISGAVEPLPNNMICHAWMHANAAQRTEFVRAHWIDIMWVRDRLAGAALPSSTPPASNVDATPAKMVVTPETEAQRSQA
jgi:hypothetical protein